MTLISGYIRNNTAYVVADSAETVYNSDFKSNVQPNEPFTAFGELSFESETEFIHESAQKIYSDKEILVAYAGYVYYGEKFVIELFEKIDHSNKTNSILEIFASNPPTETEFIIAFTELNRPRLFCFSKGGQLLSENNSVVFIGNGSENELVTTPTLVALKMLELNNIPDNLVLISLISVLQSAAVNARTLPTGVGGFFNGASVINNNVIWAEDTTCLLYSSSHFEKGERFVVNKYNRDNAIMISSPHTGRSIYFPKVSFLEMTLEEWKRKWLDELVIRNSTCQTEWVTCICYDRRIITILKRDSEGFTKNLEIKRRDDSLLDLNVHSGLITKMLTIPINPETGKEDKDGFGMTFHVI